ncbi:MAG: sulfur carrier protein ThiS [Thermincola sp.]|jgi:sulfur carrier protein|nr:sulfur carrier protein ThiS [Thermincola sp.]
MKIKVNGQEIEVDNGLTILSLLEGKKINPAAVVVEHNLAIPAREKWADIQINEGDTIEIVKFMGGG